MDDGSLSPTHTLFSEEAEWISQLFHTKEEGIKKKNDDDLYFPREPELDTRKETENSFYW